MIGVPDKRMIEELCVCIKLEEGEECTEDEIRTSAKERYVRHVIRVCAYCRANAILFSLINNKNYLSLVPLGHWVNSLQELDNPNYLLLVGLFV